MISPHQWAFFIWAVLTAITCAIGLKLRDTPRARAFDLGIGIVLALGYLVVNAWWFHPANLVPHSSLPIQLCDLAALWAVLAILTGHRAFRALLYFWGFGLSTQGFITPTIEGNPALGEFWMHWINHGTIVGGAVYDLVVLRFRPTWRDLRTAIIAGVVYLFAMLALNLATGWNYGYVGNSKPQTRSIIDVLGPWPLRVVWIALIAAGAMTALMLPWVIARRIRPPKPAE